MKIRMIADPTRASFIMMSLILVASPPTRAAPQPVPDLSGSASLQPSYERLRTMGQLILLFAAQGTRLTADAAERQCGWYHDNYRVIVDRLTELVTLSSEGGDEGLLGGRPLRVPPELERTELFCRALQDRATELDPATASAVVVTGAGPIVYREALRKYREVRTAAAEMPAPEPMVRPAPRPTPRPAGMTGANAAPSEGQGSTEVSQPIDVALLTFKERRSEEHARRGLLYSGLAAVGVSLGVAGLGAGFLVGWRMEDNAAAGSISLEEVNQHRDQAQSYLRSGLISLGVGAAVLATGVVLAVSSAGLRAKKASLLSSTQSGSSGALVIRFP